MSLQLIYTSASQLLEPGLSGYGVVARSESMRAPLARKLVAISGFKDEHCIKGPQYSYHIIDCGYETYHVLSCIQDAGADYTGRRCHIAQHFALSKQEVQSLRSAPMRPTPAGIILALAREDFWLSRWDGKPCYINKEPRLTSASLPDTEQLSAWECLTGQKTNAQAFNTPPYEHDCLILLEDDLHSMQIIQLFNESDSLDSNSGWGKTFTSTGDKQNTFAETQRITAREGGVLEARARRTGRPTLRINQSLSIAAPSMLEPEPEPEPEQPAAAQRLELARALYTPESNAPPYIYREPADNCIYTECACAGRSNIKTIRSAKLFISVAIIILGIALGLYVQLSQPLSEDRILSVQPPPKSLPQIVIPIKDKLKLVVQGNPAPLELRQALTSGAIYCRNGEISITPTNGNPSRVYKLHEGHYFSYIYPTSRGGYRIAIHQDSDGTQVEELSLKLNKRFHSIQSNQQDVFLRIKSHNHNLNYLFIPLYKLKLISQPGRISSISSPQLNIKLQEGDLQICNNTSDPAITLSPCKSTQIEEIGSSIYLDIPLQRPHSIYLPQIEDIKSNVILHSTSQSESPLISDLVWTSTAMGQANHISLTRLFDAGRLLDEQFEDICALSIFGQSYNNPAHMSRLAQLLHILHLMDEQVSPKELHAHVQKYCQLLRHPGFLEAYNRILINEPYLCIDALPVLDISHQERAEIKHQLQNPAIREHIRKRINQAIENALEQYYEQAFNYWQTKPIPKNLVLELSHVKYQGGILHWYFQLRLNETYTQP